MSGVALDAHTDVVELCALLQCLGYSVKSLDSSDVNISQDGGPKTVVINCPMSGLHVVLESGNMSCSCPAQNLQNSGTWEVSGMAGGKKLDKEFGSNLLGSLPKAQRERLTADLYAMIRSIREQNESMLDVDKLPITENKSASMNELTTPEKLLNIIKADTPTRYRSLDTLTSAKQSEDLPEPRLLQRDPLPVECPVDCDDKKEIVPSTVNLFARQSTYTIASTPGIVRSVNKTSSPISSQNTLLQSLLTAEQTAEDLRNQLSHVISELFEGKNDSSMSSLVLDVSKISVKAPETSKPQFASSPNLSRIGHEDLTKSRLKRMESVSTSNLAPKANIKEGKIGRLRRISPNIFKTKKESPSTKTDSRYTPDPKSRLSGLFKPKIVKPIQTQKSISVPEPSPNLSTSSKKKYSYVKSTIPRLSKKE